VSMRAPPRGSRNLCCEPDQQIPLGPKGSLRIVRVRSALGCPLDQRLRARVARFLALFRSPDLDQRQAASLKASRVGALLGQQGRVECSSQRWER
jgi:hypothetical protein